MSATEGQIKATAKYRKKTYEQFTLLLRRDAEINGDFVRKYTESRNESVNSFLLRAIAETIERDKKKRGA